MEKKLLIFWIVKYATVFLYFKNEWMNESPNNDVHSGKGSFGKQTDGWRQLTCKGLNQNKSLSEHYQLHVHSQLPLHMGYILTHSLPFFIPKTHFCLNLEIQL